MKTFTKVVLLCLSVTTLSLLVTSCDVDDATIAEDNMTKAADNFEIMRRIIAYNGITDKIIMVTEGKCSITNSQYRTSVICKITPDTYIRNFYGKSDNITYFVEQMAPVPVNVYSYRRTFKPQAIIPDIDFRGNMKSFKDAFVPDHSD